MKRVVVLCTLVLFVLSGVALAQTAQQTTQTSATPHVAKYLWISTGSMNPGKAKVFANIVRQIKDSAEANKADFYWLAGYNITGNDREVTFVTFHDNLASVDTAIKAMDKVDSAAMMKNANLSSEAAEAEGPGHSVLAKYREDLSYNPMKVDAAHATRWLVVTFALKPGSMMQAEDLMKEDIELTKKGNPEDHWLTYQVLAGGSDSTFMFIVPLRTLADLDEMEKQGETMKAVYTKPVRQHFASVMRDTVAYTYTGLIAVDPQMSRPHESMIAANPDFWTVKESAPVVAGKGKKMKKGAMEPAAMKETKK